MNRLGLDISLNRQAVKYTPGEITRRVCWGITKPLFAFSPRSFFRWRCFLLRVFGAQIGQNVHVYNSATIYFPWNLDIGNYSAIGEHAYIYNLGKIVIGERATISHRAHLCAGTHDFCNPNLPLLKPPIAIGDQAWICADAFIGPNVVVGEGAVVGARAVVTKDVGPWDVVAGNPARVIKKRILEVECNE